MRFTAVFIMPPYGALDLILLVLAVLYVGHVMVQTAGPFGVFQKLRDKTRKPLRGLLDCIWCVVFWAALALFLLHQFAPGITWVFAMAGAAMALRSYTGSSHNGN
jgi:hypothetical protein